jgi:uncharacterized protein (DUF305 family)
MENSKNKNLMHGVSGLVIGLVISHLFFNYHTNRMDDDKQYSPVAQGGMHMMADGTMMSNGGNSMDSMMQDMMAGLQGKTGDAFDKEFLAEMIVHHQGAVEMAKAVLATSKRPELIKLASDIISAQTKEIGMMQDWQKAWFK